MDKKQVNESFSSDSAAAEAVARTASPEQVRLVQEKLESLQKARDLQVQLATVRAELTKIDREMMKTGFRVPALNCW